MSDRPMPRSVDVALADLMAVRQRILWRQLQRPRPANRAPRVCLYDLATSRQVSKSFLGTAHGYAARQGWKVTRQRFTDQTDGPEAPDPLFRPGWSSVRSEIRAGRIDGVLVPAYRVISSDLDEYEFWICLIERHRGFIALMASETREDKQ
ncbi:hypothetical protein [Streptomyces sp. DW26H14]|uniref:hypothetical protein n=1 Tax=Streptomyces sp. DW26H14 TaxID=3435395 RepID=UPI00403D7907